MTITATCAKYGDDVNTDLIIAGKYTKTLSAEELALHCMEDLDPQFPAKAAGGLLVVAGENFGCGSSREQVPVALAQAGVKGVLAKSFSRIFFRNAINIGLPAVECDTDRIEEGDELCCDIEAGVVENRTRHTQIPASRLPDVMQAILACDGVVNYIKKNGKL